MRRLAVTTTAVSALLASTFMGACSNIERSRELSNPTVAGHVTAVQVCSSCHGMDGNSVSPAFPRLAGQQASYIDHQLKNFRAHQRSDPDGATFMWGISRNLTDEQIRDMADYYSKQTPQPVNDAAGDIALASQGKQIYENGIPEKNVIACVNCHGPKAQGNESFPRLANQHAYYIVKQLDIFQNTHGRPDTAMDAVVPSLTADNKRAVASYLQTLTQ